MSGKLKPIAVAHLVRKHTPGLYNDGNGLYLQVGPNSASWIFRYRSGGRRSARDMGLGSCHTLSLAEARERARECRKILLEGKDPIEARKAEREERRVARALEVAKSMSFAECAEAYLAANEGSWKNARHRQQWRNSLSDYVFPTLGDFPVQQVDQAGIIKVLLPIWHEKAETARRVRSRVETVIEWAIAAGFFIGDNPAKRERLKHLLGTQGDAVQHHKAVSYAEIGDLVIRLRQLDDDGALPLEFCILTATRTSEVLGSDWSEVDWSTRTWTIPGERRKGRKGKEAELTVPLSSRALEILDTVAKHSGRAGLIFRNPIGERLHPNALLDALKRLNPTATVHGTARSGFRDWAGDCTNFPREIAEAALGHKTGSEVERAYRRGSALEKRRQLMELWARHCATPSGAMGEVVALRGAR